MGKREREMEDNSVRLFSIPTIGTYPLLPRRKPAGMLTSLSVLSSIISMYMSSLFLSLSETMMAKAPAFSTATAFDRKLHSLHQYPSLINKLKNFETNVGIRNADKL